MPTTIDVRLSVRVVLPLSPSLTLPLSLSLSLSPSLPPSLLLSLSPSLSFSESPRCNRLPPSLPPSLHDIAADNVAGDGTWGISVARSTSAVGAEYTDRLPLTYGIPAEHSGTCGISYPMLNVLDGELYVYYAAVLPSGQNLPFRSRLVPV